MDSKQQPDYNQPVAYDKDGRPLYAHPPAQPLTTDQSSHVTSVPPSQPGENYDPRTRVQYANEPDVRHVARDLEPPKLAVSEENQRRHEDAKTKYPFLNLSDGEYIILAVRRHPIGLFIPVAATIVGIVLVYVLAFLFIGSVDANGARESSDALKASDVFSFASLLALLIGLFGYMYVWVYLQNKFFLTNESVIQEIQQSLFAKHEQTASLGSIEDASYKQNNLLQVFFNYGTIRLSTEGDETTYVFHYVANPKKQIAKLNNAVEAFKNGRPVSPGDDN